jgi:hypothetical protein
MAAIAPMGRSYKKKTGHVTGLISSHSRGSATRDCRSCHYKSA